MEKTKMGQETRHKILYDKFHSYASSFSYYCEDAEAKDRINKAFERFIDSILDIDYTNELSTDYIYNNYIAPLVKYAIIIERLTKCRFLIKNEEISSDNEISRRKMNDPEIRRKALEDLFHQVSLCICYQNVPEEARDRINKAFERYIKSIVDIMDIDGLEMLVLHIEPMGIGQIFYHYIMPLVDFALRVEANNPEEK